MSPRAAMEITDAHAAKRRQILDGARKVFSEHGFERASVDLVAARAGVSKATVYNHFRDKRALFVAAVVDQCDDLGAELRTLLEAPPGDVEQALRTFGEQLMTVALSPPVVRLYRAAIAEAERMPEIGRMVFERGTVAVQDAIAAQLRRWDAAGALRVEDPRSAAVAFLALCHGDLVVRMRLGVLERPVEAQVRATVARAVRIFVRAHRP